MAAPTKKIWADQPFELIPHCSTLGFKAGDKIPPIYQVAEEMIIVHNLLLRGINSIYNQCLHVPKDAIPDFANYCLTWGLGVEEHHHTEETLFFPALAKVANKPDLMGAEVAQHEAFHAGLEGYINEMKAIVAGEKEFDGARIRSIIDNFMPQLREHLGDEIQTLKNFDQFDQKMQDELVAETKKCSEVIKKNAQKNPDAKYTILPYIIMQHDTTFEGGVHAHFPGLPWIAKIMVDWFLIPKHKNWWRFAPCDHNGKPKDLPYVG